MSHDHLELTALHPWHRWVPQVSSGLLSLTTILALVALWGVRAYRRHADAVVNPDLDSTDNTRNERVTPPPPAPR